MLTTRPKPNRVRITARDVDGGGPSKTITVYQATVDGVIDLVRRAVNAQAKTTERRRGKTT